MGQQSTLSLYPIAILGPAIRPEKRLWEHDESAFQSFLDRHPKKPQYCIGLGGYVVDRVTIVRQRYLHQE